MTHVDEQTAVKTKFLQWHDVLGGHDVHSVVNQIFNLMWDMAVFRMVVRARSLTTRNDDGDMQLNGAMHRLLDVSFFKSQFMGIRRIVDVGPSDLNHRKAVYSLVWLIDDLRTNRPSLTRRNLFAVAGIPIDEHIAAEANIEITRQGIAGGCMGGFIPFHADVEAVRNLHSLIDQLAGVSPSNRSDSDTVDERFFTLLEEQLAKIDPISDHVNKFIAHAATPASRQRIPDSVITIGMLNQAHEIICRSYICLSYLIGLRSHQAQFLPTPSVNPTLNLDRPLVTPDQLEAVKQAWDEFARDSETWGLTSLGWLLNPHRNS